MRVMNILLTVLAAIALSCYDGTEVDRNDKDHSDNNSGYFHVQAASLT